jgi:septum formation protein
MRLILASASPRRKEFLSFLGLPFEVVASPFEERLTPGLGPAEQARLLAVGKAEACADSFPDAWVLGSDTLIDLDGEVIGKPTDEADAETILRRLVGREHLIHTAVALIHQQSAVHEVGVVTVRVWMKPATELDIHRYVATGEPMGKAGAYAVQGRGADLITCLEGDFTAAVGLPLKLVASWLSVHGQAPVIDMDAWYRTKPYPNWAKLTA